jgi:hypothetical protein
VFCVRTKSFARLAEDGGSLPVHVNGRETKEALLAGPVLLDCDRAIGGDQAAPGQAEPSRNAGSMRIARVVPRRADSHPLRSARSSRTRRGSTGSHPHQLRTERTLAG